MAREVRKWELGQTVRTEHYGGVWGCRKQKKNHKAKGVAGPGVQQSLHRDGGDGNWRWPPRTETHRQAHGEAIRSPFLS